MLCCFISQELIFFSSANSYTLYKALVEYLETNRKYEHAAVILKEYLNDIEEAVALLCKGRLWKRAIRIAIADQRSDLNG